MSKKLLPLAVCLIPFSLIAKNDFPPIPDCTTQPTRVITPAVAPEVIDRANVTTAADFIWWKSYLGGVEFAISGVSDGGPLTQPSIDRGKVKKPPFAWAPGIKLSIGVDYRLDGWNTTATYTGLFTDHERTSVHYDATKGLVANVAIVPTPTSTSLETSFGADPIIEADCSWKQKFNVVDVDLARNFFISRTLTLRPHFGLKFSWIQEKFDLNYPRTNLEVITLPIPVSAIFTMDQRQWGIGIRAGMNGVWHITKEFGVYGDFAATALWSSFRTYISEIPTLVELRLAPPVNVTSTPTTLLTNGRLFEVLPILELGLGLEYMTWFNKDTCLFFARAGWEEQIWSDFNQFVLPLDRMHGDLSLHGLSLRLGFTF